MEYGKTKKKMCFEYLDGPMARLIIKLRHQRMSRSEFFRAIIEGYNEDNPHIDKFFDEYRKTKKNYSKYKETIIQKERDLEKKIINDFALNEDEIEDIYDLFEEETDI